MRTARKSLFLVLVVVLMLMVVASAALAKAPTKVMIVVMDQMRPEYAKQYDMTNVLWLQNHGVNFSKAYVGDMASETVVSHNVMVSGLFPKHMGWSDEAFRDVDNVLGFGAGAIVTSGDLGFAQYEALIQSAGDYPKLGDYLRDRIPGHHRRQRRPEGLPGRVDGGRELRPLRAYGVHEARDDPAPDGSAVDGTYRGPRGIVPSYISYGPALLRQRRQRQRQRRPPAGGLLRHQDRQAGLALSGGRPLRARSLRRSRERRRLGRRRGMAIMDNEDWSGMFVTLSAIDKIGHMWGGGRSTTQGTYTWDPNSMFNWVHMPFAAKNADDQLGRIIDKLRELGQLDDTLIVLTADHGAEAATNGYFGNNVSGGGNLSWYAGTWHARHRSRRPRTPGPAALQPLIATGNVDFSYQSTAIETWLKDFSWAKKVEAAEDHGHAARRHRHLREERGRGPLRPAQRPHQHSHDLVGEVLVAAARSGARGHDGVQGLSRRRRSAGRPCRLRRLRRPRRGADVRCNGSRWSCPTRASRGPCAAPPAASST